MVRSMRAVFVICKHGRIPLTHISSCQQYACTGAQQDDGMHGAGQRQHEQKSCSLMPVHA